MTTTPKLSAPPITSMRILVGFLAAAVVTFGIVLLLVLPESHYPPIWVPWALGGLALISHLLSRSVGFNVKPVPANTPPAEAMDMAVVMFRTSTVLRFVLCESVAIIALVLSFAVPPASWMTYLVGGTLALVLIGVNVWPSTAVISRAQQQLDRDGGQSFLRDALEGMAPGTTASGVIRS
ncbi:MAG: hypothetical protein ABIP19_06355 [Dermatophilaceae bacterium]